MDALFGTVGPPAQAVLVLGGAMLLGLALHAVLFWLVGRLTTRLPGVLVFQGALLRRVKRPLRLLLPLLVVRAALPVIAADLPSAARLVGGDVLYFLAVFGVAWLLTSGVGAVEDAVMQHYDASAEDNLAARKALTQAKILKRIAAVLISLVALAVVLMHYETFRELGTGLLASAGVAGLVVGLAAQRTLANLLAGIQLAITQPIRVDDVVIVEGEFGRVEEITLTYVVVRVWDQRRIVAPIAHFIEKPFQNWTRTSSDLLGTVFLYLDYAVPVESLRAEHQRLLEASAHWDGRAAAVQVTDATKDVVEVRLLQSAASAASLFDLRCEVRERMIAFVQERYPEALPKVRAEMTAPAPDDPASREADEGA